MALSYESIVNKNYRNKLKNERSSKGLYNTVYIPKNLTSLRILPISNLFYGNEDCPPRLKLLDDHIQRINDMENGAFFLGGNLFYYPPGKTHEKEDQAKVYINHLTKILERADKNKILFAYDGINEQKFKDDRKLAYPIETTKLLASNLDIADKYYSDTKVELDFVFNNELTNFKNQFMYGLFTSLRPISVTKNAILNKLNNNFLLNGEKTFVIDTSSSQLIRKKKKLIVSENPLLSSAIDVTWLSVAGYTDHPQTLNKGNRYTVNQKFIELKIEPRISALGQQVKDEPNIIKDEKWNRSLELLTIGVDYEKYFDPEIYEELNKVLLHGKYIKNELIQAISDKVDKQMTTKERKLIDKLYSQKTKASNGKETENNNGFIFE